MTTTRKVSPDKTVARAPQSSGLGLAAMGDLSALLDAPTGSGGPLALDLSLIDEDRNQPRTEDNPGFSAESLAELAASIRLRGVKTPISVRDNPASTGRYIINHGARRFRASKLARNDSIPGFIDNDYNEADQVVENLQRNELTAREIADYIGRELAKGIKKGDIAKAISKSAAFVSQHVTLLDLPDPIATAFNAGRVRDVTVINELVTAFKKDSQTVAEWLGDENQEITRGSVKELRAYLDEGQEPPPDDDGGSETQQASESARKDAKAADPDKFKRAVVQVKYNQRKAHLLLTRRPRSAGYAWLKYEDDGREAQARLAQVQLVALVEG